MKTTLLMVFAAAALLAHHGDAGRYDENVVVMTGTVVDLQWVDPHAVIVLDVSDEKGVNVRWQAELGGRTAPAPTGWAKNTLQPGGKGTLTGRKVQSGAPYMNLTEPANVVMTATGQELF